MADRSLPREPNQDGSIAFGDPGRPAHGLRLAAMTYLDHAATTPMLPGAIDAMTARLGIELAITAV